MIRQTVKSMLPGSIVRRLRGDYNSVSLRFWTDPKDKALIYVLRKLMGRRYIAWYAKRLDRSLRGKSGASLLTNVYFDSGSEDLDVLIDLGMKPEHTMFEFGTGEGRSAQHFVGYLNPGNYYGNDISEQRVRRFGEYFEAKGLADRAPTALVTSDNSFDWMEGRKVDFIWSHAVLSHMPDDECFDVFDNMTKIMHEGTVAAIVFTQIDGEESGVRYTSKDFFRSPSFFAEHAPRFNLECEDASKLLKFDTGSHVKNRPLGESGRLRMSSHMVLLRLAG